MRESQAERASAVVPLNGVPEALSEKRFIPRGTDRMGREWGVWKTYTSEGTFVNIDGDRVRIADRRPIPEFRPRSLREDE